MPGPTALIPALVVSGLPSERFTFEGFLPIKKGRKTRLEELSSEKRTMIFYESPHKLIKTLTDFLKTFGPERQVSITKEISKVFESTLRGNLKEVLNQISDIKVKGRVCNCSWRNEIKKPSEEGFYKSNRILESISKS